MLARVHSPVRWVRATLLSGWLFALLLVVVLILPAAGQTPEPNAPRNPVSLPDGAAAAPTPANESYVAEVIGDDVYVRSGPGTNFYQCSKLYRGDRVQVVKSQQGWSCIVPPPGCFSWIAMQYVSINPQNPTVGVLTGDNVGVYTGSDTQEAKYSTSKQVVLSRGQTVKLLGEEKDDYYKIAPPQGAYLWVSSQFLQPADKSLIKTPALDAAKTVTEKKPTDPNAPLTGLDLYYALSEKVKAEHEKKLSEQNYTELKKKLAALAANKDGGRAARYAEYTLKQVERYELACRVGKELEDQNKELQKTTSKIDEARTTQLQGIVRRDKYALVGKLETSSVYAGAAKRFRVLDESGKTICYVMPTGAIASTDFSKYIGHKVGLVGPIAARPDTQQSLIEFTEIDLLDSDK
ncbi:MAG: SH3 domain-containing protein [Planctomycetes bacterium]|nr:SH3 domain-containing protein [Planctomycetota bacterium]